MTLQIIGLFAVLFLVLGSVFVNGWTDAPNAIATVISTKVMSPKKAVIMAAIFNLIGVLVMGSAVANTISKIINFSYDPAIVIPPTLILVTLGAAQFSIIIWATAAQRFGIPTSESHALVASLSGAAFAMTNSLAAIRGDQWMKVIVGIFSSTFIGFFGGFLLVKLVISIVKNISRKKSNIAFSYLQTCSAALMAFSHGAQDGQKFMGVFVLALVLGTSGMNLPVWLTGSMNGGINGSIVLPLWIMVLCSAIMALGTSIGGYKIIKKMGMEMVKLEKYQGFSAEVVASVCMIFLTKTGIPISTTHTSASAIMGVGAVNGFKAVNLNIVKDMIMAWLLTFPVCAVIGYLMTKFFMLFIKI